MFDIAFQKYVMNLCCHDWNIESYILMADKTKSATLDGLNQLFRVDKKANHRTGITRLVENLEQTGASVLAEKNVTDIISKIINGQFAYSNKLNFSDAVTLLAGIYCNDKYANWPTSFGCKSCEFVSDNEAAGLKSGYKECFSHQHGWAEAEFEQPKTFEIWNFRKGGKLFDDGIHFMSQLTENLVDIKAEVGKLSTTERQWLQITKEREKDSSIFVDKRGLKNEIEGWKFPLYFIDFETSAVALPFTKGRRPYEQVAFQYSVHVIFEDGRIEHVSEYINVSKGVFPNFEFVRALKQDLGNEGTVFKYSAHENNILNAIYEQLSYSDVFDKADLQKFIQSISHSKKDSALVWKGPRDMVDLLEVVKKYYYNPLTKGSNSIKQVLPAILKSSPHLQAKYSLPLSAIGVTSRNFPGNHSWLSIEDEVFQNPYKKLPKLFDEWSQEELDNLVSGIEDIADGGSAMTAYGKMQYTNVSDIEVAELRKALLKYCELDTLAMVMLYEHLNELVN